MKMRVKDFEDYELDTETGTLYNHKTHKYVGYDGGDGYIKVSLHNGSVKQRTVRLHRPMAEHFIPNPDNLPEVHHINHDRTDNRLENLMWVTTKQQHDEHWRYQQSKANGTTVQVTLNGVTVQYDNLKEASIETNIPVAVLSWYVNNQDIVNNIKIKKTD